MKRLSKNHSNEEGKKLERAVASIEKFLSDYIDLNDIQRVNIKTNYRDSVDGVEYEIDVFKKMKDSDGATIIL